MHKKIVYLVMIVVIFTCILGGCVNNKGDIYSLQEAYDNGLITIDDLKSMAFYQNMVKEDETFVPIPKNPETLSKEVENAIKVTKAYAYNKQYPKKNVRAKDFTIKKYFGTYNSCIAIKLTGKFYDVADVCTEVVVEGIVFRYGDNRDVIEIWKQK